MKKINIPNKLIESNKSKELALYFLLARRRTIDYKVFISISQILVALGWQRRDKKFILETLEYFKKDGLILEYVFDDNELEITLSENIGAYTRFYIDDFELLKRLGYKIFHVYCFIQRFANDGVAYFSYEYLEKATQMSTKTFSETIKILEALGMLESYYQGWVYSEKYKKNIRKNNEYEINIDKKLEFINKPIEESIKILNEIKRKINNPLTPQIPANPPSPQDSEYGEIPKGAWELEKEIEIFKFSYQKKQKPKPEPEPETIVINLNNI
ncbi:helix-turn-helix domain-containing protein [Thermosediminibacter oceani]|uniref:Uncharacterized protein n=1 Tax=Thermosediminibacter oceani (strain ATCC BAA-1034 / DSM 16646 / JW/IW-1228P) TaxID=555079 RepID=D9S2Y2_THEOJ|nr:helix-turn-helix domain-containing protein [Thermosediminibacter oceani]ADL07759.1 hypothetical protein Toce_0997 [Thermosediminibacter oceani DSM 16646]